MTMITIRSPAGDIRTIYKREDGDFLAGYDGWEILFEQEGPPPDGGVVTATGWLVPLNVLQDRLWEQVKNIRTEKMLLAPTPFGTAQADSTGKENISGLVQMATIAKAAGAPFSEVFTMADNSNVTMNADQMIGFGVSVGRHISAMMARGRTLRNLILAATSQAELDAIDIEGGWE